MLVAAEILEKGFSTILKMIMKVVKSRAELKELG